MNWFTGAYFLKCNFGMRRQDAVNQLYNWLTATTLMMDGELRTVHGRHTTTDKAYLQVRLRHFDNKGYTLDWTARDKEGTLKPPTEFPNATFEDTEEVFQKLSTMPFLVDRVLAYVVNEPKTQVIRKWRRGIDVPSEVQLKQLKTLADEAEKLRQYDSDSSILGFLIGRKSAEIAEELRTPESETGLDITDSVLDDLRRGWISEFNASVASFISEGYQY